MNADLLKRLTRAIAEGSLGDLDRLASTIVTEPNIPRAAEVAKVGQRTIYNWLKIDIFKTELRQARRESFVQAISMAQRYAPLAMTTLAKIAADTTAPQHARVTASIGILRFGREAIELDDLAERLKVLEDTAKLEKNGDKPWASRAA